MMSRSVSGDGVCALVLLHKRPPSPFLPAPSSSHPSTLNKQLSTSPSSQKMVANKRGASSETQQRPKKIVAGSRKRITEVGNSDGEGEPQRKVRCPNVFAKLETTLRLERISRNQGFRR